MFGESPFNQDISGWDVSRVEIMKLMFAGSAFNQPIETWDVSRVEDMSMMFSGSAFNQPLDRWRVNGVLDFQFMFEHSPFDHNISELGIQEKAKTEGMFCGNVWSERAGGTKQENMPEKERGWEEIQSIMRSSALEKVCIGKRM